MMTKAMGRRLPIVVQDGKKDLKILFMLPN
jgi:hypothetical protein